MINPIYIQHYSHTGCDCYKIDVPWTEYRKDTLVLCKVSDGIEKAKKLAEKILAEKLAEAMQEPVETVPNTRNYSFNGHRRS